MNRVLLKKSLMEVRLLLAGCAAVIFAFCWIRVWIVSQMEMSRFAAIVEQVWDQFKAFSPVSIHHLLSFTGRIGIGWDEPMVVFTMTIFAVTRGSDVVSGELGRGTLEMLLSQPVSRWQIIATNAVVTIAGLAVLAACSWFGTWCGVATNEGKIEIAARMSDTIPFLPVDFPNPFGKPKIVKRPLSTQVDMKDFVPAATNLFFLGFFLAGFATLLSACDRYRWRTIGLTIAFFIASVVAKVIGLATTRFAFLKWLSVFTAYEPQKFIDYSANDPDMLLTFARWVQIESSSPGHYEYGPLPCNLILAGLGVAAYLAAIEVFRRRDLPAPL